ncbi:hypothetical protein ACFOX0_23040 [Micromonospora zhanjiangensis]|uniref:4-amino-4-deoxy-L-arabinose transferase n=1 Tax=Micromonospora zhanjiangensis TaxID=1522057 RepID=A0ABV8KSA9_9ACTN
MTSRVRATQDADPGTTATPGESSVTTGSRWARWESTPFSRRGGATPPPTSWRARWLAAARARRVDLVVCLFFVLLAGWLTHGLWPDPAGRVLALNPQDQTLYEWFLASDARVLYGDFSLLSHRLNAPDGVNLMANTTVIALGVLFAPVTWAFGAATSFALLVAGDLAGTAIAWYLLYRRALGAGPLAAGLGAGLCGFGPGIVSQSNSHLHMTAQFLIPVMVWMIVRMVRAADPAARPAGGARTDWRRVFTSAVGLAATVVVQVFIGEEVLLLTALTLAAVTVTYALARPSLVRRVLPGFLAGMTVATGLAGLLLTYPLWFQFAGPQSVSEGMFSPHYFSADLASWPAISPLSVAGSNASARLSTGPAEYNTFLGPSLLIVAVLCAAWLIRRPLVIACVVAGLLMAALSLGPLIVLEGDQTGLTGPYSALLEMPVVDGALPMRFALAVLPLLATVLVVAVERARQAPGSLASAVVPVVVVVALLPIFPAPLPTTDRSAVPEFISAGHWRDCVQPGGVLVPVPLPTPPEPEAMRWATTADVSFGLPEGFFIGPYGENRGPSMGTYKQPTSALLAEVAKTGVVPPIGETERQRARQDLSFWRASCVVLADGAPYPDSLRAAVEALLGPAERVADAWTWKIR